MVGFAGVKGGEYNGLSKVINNTLAFGSFTKLSVNSNNVWTRNTWQHYELKAQGSTISAYLNNNLIASTTDSSIYSGTYGFLSYSQAKTYFKNVVVQTFHENSLTDIINNVNWLNDDVNVVINFNNSSEPLLQNQACINTFNNDSIYYIGVNSTTNQNEVNTFINNINNRGKYVDSSDYNTSINNIVNYLASILH